MKKSFVPFVNRRYAHAFGEAAGDFTASQHLEFLLKAEEVWADGKFSDDLKANATVGQQVLANQSAKFQQLDNPEKDNQVKITWIRSCGVATSDFDREDDSCTPVGTELSTSSKTYSMTELQKVTLMIDEEEMRTNQYSIEEQVAHLMIKGDKLLAEWWCKKLLTAMKAFAGPNIAAINGKVAPFTWDGANTTTNIPGANYTVKMMATLLKTMQLNLVQNGYFVEAGDLFESWVNAGFDSSNLDGKGDSSRKAAINLEFDMWNFVAAALSESMFLIDRNAIAFKTYNRFTSVPKVLGGKIGQTRYSMPSKVLPGVSWDVRYQLACQGGHDQHTFQFETQGGIFLNPEACPQTIGGTSYTPTGVYSFTKTA